MQRVASITPLGWCVLVFSAHRFSKQADGLTPNKGDTTHVTRHGSACKEGQDLSSRRVWLPSNSQTNGWLRSQSLEPGQNHSSLESVQGKHSSSPTNIIYKLGMEWRGNRVFFFLVSRKHNSTNSNRSVAINICTPVNFQTSTAAGFIFSCSDSFSSYLFLTKGAPGWLYKLI